MTNITIRKAALADVDEIMDIIAEGRAQMRAAGNYEQWTGGYPSEELVRGNIADVCGYVVVRDDDSLVLTTGDSKLKGEAI